MTLLYHRPTSDVSADGWTDQADATTGLVGAIDETSADNDNYVQAPSGGDTLSVRLYDGATEIVEWFHDNISETFGTVEQTLTTPQFEAITDFGNLFVEFDDNVGNVYRFALDDPEGGISPPINIRYSFKKAMTETVVDEGPTEGVFISKNYVYTTATATTLVGIFTTIGGEEPFTYTYSVD